MAAPGTEIVPLTARRGPRVIGTRAENALAAAAVIELLAEHAGSADAALIAISFDTALDGAREAAPFPVVGMTEAALHAAALLGGPIGFIGPVRRVLNVYRGVVERDRARRAASPATGRSTCGRRISPTRPTWSRRPRSLRASWSSRTTPKASWWRARRWPG